MQLQGKTALVTGSTSGIGLAIARALAAEGASVMINGFGDADEIEAIRARARGSVGRAGALRRRRPDRGRRDRGDDRALRARARQRPTSSSTMPASSIVAPVDRLPGRQMGRDHRAQPHRRVPHHPARAAGDEARRAGAGSSTPPRRTASSPAPTSRPMSPPSTASPASPRRSRWRRRTTASPSTASRPGYVWTPLVENQIPDTMKARGLTREQVMNDVLLAAQPTKKFVTVDQVAALALFLCRDEAGVDHRRQPQRWTAAGPRPRLRRHAHPSLAAAARSRSRACATIAPADAADRRPTDWRAVATDSRPRAAARLAQRLRHARCRQARAAGHGAEIDARRAPARCPTPRSARRASPTAITAAASSSSARRARACSIISPTPPSPAACTQERRDCNISPS